MNLSSLDPPQSASLQQFSLVIIPRIREMSTPSISTPCITQEPIAQVNYISSCLCDIQELMVFQDSAHADTQASLECHLNQPAVPLEHIDCIKNIQCPSDNEMSFTFDDADIFDKAVKAWPESGTPFILIDATEGCGKSQQRTFFQVKDYTTDKKMSSVKANGEIVSPSDPRIVKSFQADWKQSKGPSAVSSAQDPKTTKPPSVLKRFQVPGWDKVTSKAAGVVSGATSVAGDATSKIASVATSAASAVTSAGGAVASDVKSHLPTGVFSKGVSGNININPTGSATSPWGPAKSLGTVDGVTIYCIECGASGNIAMDGSISFGSDLKDGAVDISATNFEIPMVFGFEAKDAKSPSIPFKFQIFSEGIIPFELPGFFTFGPMLTVDVAFQIAVSASGFLEAGVHYKWDKAQAHMDLTNKDASKSKYTGWAPSVEKVFNLSGGQIDVKGTLGVPISLGAGINIFGGQFTKNVSITDEPSITLDTIINTPSHQKRFEDRNHARDLLIREDKGQCSNGIQEIISFGDSLQLNVLDLWNTQLATFSTQLYSTCIQTASSSDSSSVRTSGASGIAAPTGSGSANPTGSFGTASSSVSSASGSPPPPKVPTATPTA